MLLNIALLQMRIEEKNHKKNSEHGLELLCSVKEGTDVSVLPEVWTTGYSLGALRKECEEEGSELLKSISKIAKDKNMAIVAGSVPYRRGDNKIYNTTFVFDRSGEIIADYDKIHMFSLYNEERFFHPGGKRTEFAVDGIDAGLAICYDLRFPQLFRAMAVNGANIVFMPAEWPESRGAAWRLLVQARAVESQMYICAVNCTGKFRDDIFYGHSMLVSPTGDIVAEGSSEESIIYGAMDTVVVEKARTALSVLKDGREELYVI